MSNVRQCPKCGTSLSAVIAGGITVDGCPGCGGLWFDAQELGRLAQGGPGTLSGLERQFAPSAAAGSGRSAAAAARLCPVCRVSMREFEFPWARGIWLDGCPECRGIWVDEGELGAIERTMIEARAQRAGTGSPAGAAQPGQAAGAQQRARMAASVLTSVPCPKCAERNSPAVAVCWACGGHLKQEAAGLLCAVCHGPMQRFSTQGMQLDGCRSCGGLWLDRGELGSLMQLTREALSGIETQVRGGEKPRVTPAARTTMLPCPACHRAMQEHPYAVHSGVRIDQCDECRGVWLDAGELLAIQEFVAKGDLYRPLT